MQMSDVFTLNKTPCYSPPPLFPVLFFFFSTTASVSSSRGRIFRLTKKRKKSEKKMLAVITFNRTAFGVAFNIRAIRATQSGPAEAGCRHNWDYLNVCK